MVLNYENDLTQKCAYHVSYEVYQYIFIFWHHRYHNHFVLRVDRIYQFCTLKYNRIPKEHLVLNALPLLNFRRSF